MRFSKKIVITMFITVFLFVVTMILTYWFKGGVPDSLIEQFFGFFGFGRNIKQQSQQHCAV